MNIFRQRDAAGPGVWRINRAAGPVHRDASLAKPRKLIQQQHNRGGPGPIDVQYVARQ